MPQSHRTDIQLTCHISYPGADWGEISDRENTKLPTLILTNLKISYLYGNYYKITTYVFDI